MATLLTKSLEREVNLDGGPIIVTLHVGGVLLRAKGSSSRKIFIFEKRKESR